MPADCFAIGQCRLIASLSVNAGWIASLSVNAGWIASLSVNAG
jgi:hypothetical protein